MRPYEQIINQAADARNVPRAVGQALVDTENGERKADLWMAESWGGGSYGLTMITRRTAESIGFPGPPERLLDPATNASYGFLYLRRMFDKVGQGSWRRAIAAYNAGPDLDPWPTKHLERFTRNLEKWKAKYPLPDALGPTGGVRGRDDDEPGIPDITARHEPEELWMTIAEKLQDVVNAIRTAKDK